MVHIYKDYFLGADGITYILYREGKSKNGERTIVADCYPSSIKHAVEIVMRKEQQAIAKNEELLLKEYLEKISQLNETFQNILYGIEKSEQLVLSHSKPSKSVR